MIVERGIAAAEEPDPVKWVPVKRYCSAGCLLTVSDFPEGEA